MRSSSLARTAALTLLALGLLRPASPEAQTVRVRIIVVAGLAEANRIRGQLEAGSDFAALARERSLDPSAADGGAMGAVHPTSLRAELQAALKSLQPGQISAVVSIPTGHAILKRLADDEDASGPANATDAPAAGLPQFAGMRYPANTSGTFDVEALFRARPKPRGWNSDAGSLCELHSATPALAIERISEFLSRPDMDSKLAPQDLWQARYMWAALASYQGHLPEAIAQWEKAYQICRAHLPDNVAIMEEVLGSTHLHKAEMDNGLYRDPDDRCLFPPRAGVPYRRLENTADLEKALRYFALYLEKKPDDLNVKWLLNLAYFYLGRYPDGVPAPHLIPPRSFDSQQAAGRFVDVARAVGLTRDMFISGGMLVDDFDGDGLLDIVTASYDICDRFRFFHNRGDGTFEDRGSSSGLAKIAGGQGITQTDFDNDGCLDLLVLRGAWQVPMPQSLVRNNCDGTFTEVTEKAGLGDMLFATQIGIWADFDNDGWVDLFIGNEQGPSQMFRNQRDGTFANVSSTAGVDRRTSFVKGAMAEDYDNDGDADLFVSNIRGGDNLLYRNNGDWTFTDVAKAAGVNQSWASFATWFFDYDNDGWSDLFVVSDYASVDESLRSYLGQPRNAPPHALYRNTGRGTFENVTAAAGLDRVYISMGANFGDVDNDGYLDIYLGNGAPDYGAIAPNVLLRNDAGRTFQDITTATDTGELHKTHGIAIADLENDGQKDIVASIGGAVPADAHALRLFRNPGNDNDWISVKLAGAKTNRAAIGARLELVVENGGTRRSIHRTINSGGSFGTSPLTQSIGLGPSARIAELNVSWPASGTRQTFKDVATNQFIEIRELASSYATLRRKTFQLAGVEPAARYPAVGLVIDVDRSEGTVVVSHHDIPGLMDAMTMPFTVRDPKELEGTAPGTMIDFTVVVEGGTSHIEGVRPRALTGTAQPVQAERMQFIERLVADDEARPAALEIGETVPDFTLVDQQSRPVTFSGLAGKVVAVSFMYTKCRLPNFCFRLSNNFGILQKRFADRLGKDLVLLTISFDALHDRPEVLAEYAKTWNADARGWHMLTGPEDEVRRVCRQFGMNFWPDMGMISHTLHTIVIDRRGRVAARLAGNEFTAEQLGDLVSSVMSRPSGNRAAN